MLAYTAVDSLRAISRDFDLDWQPTVSENVAASSRNWRGSLRTGQGPAPRILGALLALLPISVVPWLR
jgi:hypothetical protein